MSTIINVLVTSAVIGAIMGGIIGGIAGGAKGAMSGIVRGMITAPLFTLFTMGAGIGLSALVSAVTGIALSGAAGIFVVGSLMAMYFIKHTVKQMERAETEREFLALEIQLGFIVVGWLVGLAGLGKHYVSNWSKFGQVRSTYKANAAEIKRLNQQWIKEGVSPKVRSERVFQLRHDARLQMRNQMGSELEVATLRTRYKLIYKNPDGPTYEFLVQKAKSSGLTGDAVYQYIIDGGARTSAAYNAIAGNAGSGSN